MRYFFNFIGETIKAFQPTQTKDAAVRRQVQIIESRIKNNDSLGFFKHEKIKIEEKILSILTEQGETVSKEQMELIVDYLEKTRKDQETRRRFWIQAFVTTIILSGCGWQIHSGQTSGEAEKATFGFIGAIIGYWLR